MKVISTYEDFSKQCVLPAFETSGGKFGLVMESLECHPWEILPVCSGQSCWKDFWPKHEIIIPNPLLLLKVFFF